MKRFLSFSFGVALLLGFYPGVVSAAVVKAPIEIPQGVRDTLLSPAKVELELAPGQKKSVTLSLQNRTGTKQRYRVAAEDVGASKDTTDPVQLLGQKVGQFPLRGFFSIQDPVFELDSGQVAFISISVTAPRGVSPGGRYGAITFTTEDLAASPPSGSGARFSARLAALFFVKIPGEMKESGELEDFSAVMPTLGPKDSTLLRMVFNNTGDVYLNPYGRIRITNFLGSLVKEIPVDPWFVLPKSERLREIPWKSEVLLGRYTATLELNRGYDDVIDTRQVSFWVVTPEGGFLAALFLILVISCMRWIMRKRMRV